MIFYLTDKMAYHFYNQNSAYENENLNNFRHNHSHHENEKENEKYVNLSFYFVFIAMAGLAYVIVYLRKYNNIDEDEIEDGIEALEEIEPPYVENEINHQFRPNPFAIPIPIREPPPTYDNHHNLNPNQELNPTVNNNIEPPSYDMIMNARILEAENGNENGNGNRNRNSNSIEI